MMIDHAMALLLATLLPGPRPLPPVGIAVRDSTGAWCTELPAAAPALAVGRRVRLVFVEAFAPASLRARVRRRRQAPCSTAFAQPRWDDYVAYDLVVPDSMPAGAVIPGAGLAIGSDVAWTRAASGVARADLDDDGVPEEARACLADEGEHFTIWSTARGHSGARRRAHEYLDLGGAVDANCAPEETSEVPATRGKQEPPR